MTTAVDACEVYIEALAGSSGHLGGMSLPSTLIPGSSKCHRAIGSQSLELEQKQVRFRLVS